MENDMYTAKILKLESTAKELETSLTAIIENPPVATKEPEVLKTIHSLKDGPFTVVLLREDKVIRVKGMYKEKESAAFFMQQVIDKILGYIQ